MSSRNISSGVAGAFSQTLQKSALSAVILKRAIGLSVAGCLCLIALTSLAPQWISDQSDRAIVDVPVTVVTAPISGVLTKFSTTSGKIAQPDIALAEIGNNTIDRGSLIELDSRLNVAQHNLDAIIANQTNNEAYLAELNLDIDHLLQVVKARYNYEIADLEAQLGSAEATIAEKRLIAARQSAMVAKNIYAPTSEEQAMHQLHNAEFLKQSSMAKYQQKQAELESVEKGIFSGENARELTNFENKRRDIQHEGQQLRTQHDQAAALLQSLTEQRNAEADRIAHLKHAEIMAPMRGEILSLDANVGRYLNAGDTIAHIADCKASFIVAIFSYRQGSNLQVGTRVNIDTGADGVIGGTISEVMPRTTDKSDQIFAMPFPPTERRELYVLVHPDRPITRAWDNGHPGQCDVGRWVTVTRENSWLSTLASLWRGSNAFAKTAPAQTNPETARP